MPKFSVGSIKSEQKVECSTSRIINQYEISSISKDVTEQKIDCSVSQIRNRYGVMPYIQGPPGSNGTNGVDGISPEKFNGFGQITYSHTPTSSGDFIDASGPVQLTFQSDLPPLDYLNDCFKGHIFWDGTKIIARSMYDLIEVQVNLQVKSQISGGFIQVYLDANSPSGPIVSSTATLFSAANVTERVTFLLNIQTLQNSITNGTKIFARSTVPVYLSKESILIIPRSTYSP